MKLTQNLYPLVAMKDLMKTLPRLSGTEKIEENWLTPNFCNAFQQQKRDIWIKAHGLNLTQNLYTLVVMKYLMKTLLPLLGTEKVEENCLTPNFSHEFEEQKKKYLQKRTRFEVNAKSVYTSRDEGVDENVSTRQKNCFHC